MKTILERKHLWLILLLVFSFSPSTVNSAVSIADSPCDRLYYESLSARAWLEAQREITQNQNIILKPDSVFEYTCFDRLLWELKDHADEMLSETTAYNNPLGQDSMDNALQDLVGTSLISYVAANYGYYSGLLGGHAAATGIKHTPVNVNSGGSAYSCDIMERVWKAAKCINFITDEDNDGFFTFQEYANAPSDKRHLPSACTAITTNWTNNLETALTTGPWTTDPLQTYISETTAESCSGASCRCNGAPIPTGVSVFKPGVNPFLEKVCLQPGCRYHPGGFPLYSGGPTVGEGCYGR